MSDATTPEASSESDAGSGEPDTNVEYDLLYVRNDGVPFDLKRGGQAEWTLARDTALQRLPENRFEVVTDWQTFTIDYGTAPSFVAELDDTRGILQVVMSKGGTVVKVMAAIASAFPGGIQFKQNGFSWQRSYPV